MLQNINYTRLETAGTTMRIMVDRDLDRQKQESQNTGGVKQRMRGFSKKSRLNFARAMSATNWPVQPSHVTLTYGQVTKEMESTTYYKADLKKLGRWCENHGVIGFWRLEFQERKQACLEFLTRCSCISNLQLSLLARHGRAAHFHCLVLGLTPDLELKLRKFWMRRIKKSLLLSAMAQGFSDIPKTWHFPVKVTYREAGKAAWYLALHGQKDTQAPDLHAGRWWGYFGKAAMMKLQIWTDYGNLSDLGEFRLRRIFRRLLRKRSNGRRRQSMTVFLSEKTQRKILLYLYELEHGKKALQNNENSLNKFAARAFRNELEPF